LVVGPCDGFASSDAQSGAGAVRSMVIMEMVPMNIRAPGKLYSYFNNKQIQNDKLIKIRRAPFFGYKPTFLFILLCFEAQN